MGENKMFQCNGENILPDVAELPEFNSDHLSTLSDIQEELEKLDPFEAVKDEKVLMEDVNVVDHEVTIGEEPVNEEVIVGSDEGAIMTNVIEDHFSMETRSSRESISVKTQSTSSGGNVQGENENKASSNKHSNVHIPPPLKAIRPLPEGLRGNKSFISMAQPKKNVLTKVIFSPTSQGTTDVSSMILTESCGQTIRIVGQNKSILPNSPRTLTLAQAREMGLLPAGKTVQLIQQNQPKNVVRKSVMMTGNKPLTMIKSSPTKILPLPTSGQIHAIAPSTSINSLTQSPQKIFIRQAGPSTGAARPGGFSGTLLTSGPAGSAGQLLQIPAASDAARPRPHPHPVSQIHQIQLPSKQVQYVRLVHAPVSSNGAANVATSGMAVEAGKSEPIFITATSASAVTSNIKVTSPVSLPVPNLKAVPIVPSTSAQQSSNTFERILVSPGLNKLKGKSDAKAPSNVVMVPAEYVKQLKPTDSATTTQTSTALTTTRSILHSTAASTKPAAPANVSLAGSKVKEEVVAKESTLSPTPSPLPLPLSAAQRTAKDPPNGLRPRKPCNCTKSQCLKLYCDCFANGEFCFQCNCNCCFNNLDHEEQRQHAIRACLERNPNAFRPKIGKGYVGAERRHNKGCHCKRSGCLKNYCECYEAKIPCSNNCKCIGCRNVEDSKDRIHDISRFIPIAAKPKQSLEAAEKSPFYVSSQSQRQPYTRITQHVVEAACECLLAQVQEGCTPHQVERRIIEEFGRCLVTVIGFSRTVNNTT